MKTLDTPLAATALERVLEPFGECLTPASARRIAKFRADKVTQARIEELASKSNEGELTRAEREEYEAYVRAIHLVSILQSKARMVLAKSRKPG